MSLNLTLLAGLIMPSLATAYSQSPGAILQRARQRASSAVCRLQRWPCRAAQRLQLGRSQPSSPAHSSGRRLLLIGRSSSNGLAVRAESRPG